MTLFSTNCSRFYLPHRFTARTTPSDTVCDVVIESQARHALIRNLYLNVRHGTASGQQIGCTLHVHSFASADIWSTALSAPELPTDWDGPWGSPEDHEHLDQATRAEAVLIARWTRAGTLMVRARITGGEIPVHILT